MENKKRTMAESMMPRQVAELEKKVDDLTARLLLLEAKLGKKDTIRQQ